MKLKLISSSSLILLIACHNSAESDNSTHLNMGKETIVKENQTIEIVEETEDDLSPTDIEFCNQLINNLKGIEMYVVQGNYNILSALLKNSGDTINSNKVDAFILKQNGMLNKYDIRILDKNNGYIVYAPTGAEVTYTSTYWNLKDGSKLICTEELTCGPVCSSDISFLNYSEGIYNVVNTIDIIPEFNNLQKSLFPEFDDYDIETGDPLEFQFTLPKNGKDIIYCLDEDCIVLEWKNEKFQIKQ